MNFCLNLGFKLNFDLKPKLIQKVQVTRNSSGDEIVNVNLLYDDIVHALQNTMDSCINSATDRRGYVLEPKSVSHFNALSGGDPLLMSP